MEEELNLIPTNSNINTNINTNINSNINTNINSNHVNANNYDKAIWKMIDIHFRDNIQGLVRHHIDSYNDFIDIDIPQMLKEMNPLKLELDYNLVNNKFKSSAKLYFGGKTGKLVYIGKPVIYDNDNVHYMFPNEARLRNMDYSMPIYIDIEVEITREVDVSSDENEGDKPTSVDEHGCKIDYLSDSETTTQKKQLIENIRKTLTQIQNSDKWLQTYKLQPIRKLLLNMPIMAQSKYCILHGLTKESLYNVGECKNDIGGYFIITGKEKTIVSQEKFGDNMLYIQKFNKDYMYGASIRSVSENISKPQRTLSIKMLEPSSSLSNKNILVEIPNIRSPIPLFILFRALGIISDKEIIEICMLQSMDNNDNVSNRQIIDWFEPSIHDAGGIHSQEDALQYISIFVKGQTVNRTLHILADYLLPHIGEINFVEKAFYIGYMVNKIWLVSLNLELPTDRDNYKYKRIELVGSLLRDLFREYYTLYQANIRRFFETKYEFNKELFNDISNLIEMSHEEVFEKNILNEGFKKAFKGNWGSSPHTKRIGVVQDLNRLSNLGYISHLRKTNLPLDASTKLIGPRRLHCSQWGIIDPIDTPDGGNIGTHKSLSILTYITRNHSREPIITWLKTKTQLFSVSELLPEQLGKLTKIFVNG